MNTILKYWGHCVNRGDKPRHVFAVFDWSKSDGEFLYWSLSQTDALKWIGKHQTAPATLDVTRLQYGGI